MKNFDAMFHKERIHHMKMTIFIQIGAAAFVTATWGCATSAPEKYVGTWGGRSVKAKGAVMVKLEEGGGGYATTLVGAVPLKWREADANHLDVRFSCGDGFLSFYNLAYSPEDKKLKLLRQKTIRFRDGKVSNDHTFEGMVLSYSNEYGKAMAPMIEYTEKAREIHAKSDKTRRQRLPELITNRMSLATWDDISRLDKNLLDGWSVGLSSAERPIPSISISKRTDGKIDFTIHAGRFAIGNPEDTCNFERPGRHGISLPVESVPPNAVPFGDVWDEGAETDTIRRIRNMGWKVARSVYYEEHFFYGIFHTRYSIQTGDMPIEKLLDSIRECLGATLKPPIDVFLWRPKPHDVSTRTSNRSMSKTIFPPPPTTRNLSRNDGSAGRAARPAHLNT